jgi:hypothetical protein
MKLNLLIRTSQNIYLKKLIRVTFYIILFFFNLFNIIIREGRGISKFADGSSYDGDWKNGKK